MSGELKDIQGDFSASGNITAGQGADMKGSVSVGHDLDVKGWLFADNAVWLLPFKGVFDTESDLKKAYPDPRPGWFALVAYTLFDLYVEKDGSWKRESYDVPVKFKADVSNMHIVIPENAILTNKPGKLNKVEVVNTVPDKPAQVQGTLYIRADKS